MDLASASAFAVFSSKDTEKLIYVKHKTMFWSICEMFVILRTNDYGMMENNHQTVDHKKIARYAKALGHPTRVAIMCFLAKQEQCYFGDIHEELPIAKATVSQHLKELKDAELIQGEVETPKVRYCINGTAWNEARQLFVDFFGLGVHKKESCCE